MAFVNPYTFISFPDEVKRKHPLLGHAPTREQASERFTGQLNVRWRVQTPLAIPHKGEWGLGEVEGSGTQIRGNVRIPGASVKGAVRSLHEALFAGCARVIDEEYVPIYREMMTPSLQEDWTLAVVMQVQEPDTIRVMPCKPTVKWVRGDAIQRSAVDHHRNPVTPRTGDFVRPDRPVFDEMRPNKYEAVSGFLRARRNGTMWLADFKSALARNLSVILVTSTLSRPDDQPYYWAAATPDPDSGVRTLSPAVLRHFRRRMRGAERVAAGSPEFEDVKWPPNGTQVVAQRRSPDATFRQGDVLWIKIGTSGEIVDIKPSLGWRRETGGSNKYLRTRVPKSVLPCQHLGDGLCLSCSIFGSASVDHHSEDSPGADEHRRRSRRGEQDSYGAHVRFHDITGECTNGEANVELAPLGTPSVGAGMYYLLPITHDDMQKKLLKNDLPSMWDSAAGESKGVRHLRGRKFYWHSNPDKQKAHHNLSRHRYRRQRIHTNPDLLPKVHLVKEAELSQVITFDGLDAVSLASLLATLDPGLLFGEGDFALHLGRGKPLGLGTVKAEFNLEMTTTADRYSENPKALTEVPDLSSVLVDGIRARCGDLTQIHIEAKKILNISGLGDAEVFVSYPTVAQWSKFGTDAFHESFKFFADHSGKVTGKRGQEKRGPWAPMPLLSETVQKQEQQ